MYFINKESGLKDKKIIFTHFAQFAEFITIITEYKGIFVCDKDEEGVLVLNEHQARNYILNSDYLRTELNKLNVILDEEVKEYQRQLEEKWKKDKEMRGKQQEERDYKEYLRLKEKFENKEE